MYQLQVGESGKAVGVEHIDELVKESIKNVKKDPATAQLLESGRLKLFTGDGRRGRDILYLKISMAGKRTNPFLWILP